MTVKYCGVEALELEEGYWAEPDTDEGEDGDFAEDMLCYNLIKQNGKWERDDNSLMSFLNMIDGSIVSSLVFHWGDKECVDIESLRRRLPGRFEGIPKPSHIRMGKGVGLGTDKYGLDLKWGKKGYPTNYQIVLITARILPLLNQLDDFDRVAAAF